MVVRINILLRECNLTLDECKSLLEYLGYKEDYFSCNTKIDEDIAEIIRLICKERKLRDLLEKEILKERKVSLPNNIKIVGQIDLEAIKKTPTKANESKANKINYSLPNYKTNVPYFAIKEVLVENNNKLASINFGKLKTNATMPLYSAIIGSNGIGKSLLLRNIIDFFIDLDNCSKSSTPKPSFSKSPVRGIVYEIDGVECFVARLDKAYLAEVNGKIMQLENLKLPQIVACHFGAFDKLPFQSINGSVHTKYDVQCYKYVGAHASGNIISSSSIAFRLLFALSQKINDKLHKSLCTVLDYIGYGHKISLDYTIRAVKNKGLNKLSAIENRSLYEQRNIGKQNRTEHSIELMKFLKEKTSKGINKHSISIDLNEGIWNSDLSNELAYIYELKQIGWISSTNIIFQKQGAEVSSEQMSSGEFIMLATILSITIAASEKHTLILYDEPELSLHPNWQMTIIDNLDKALSNIPCHVLIASHSHLLVSDLPMERSSVIQMEKDADNNLITDLIESSTYGWSPEEVLLKVFKTSTERNRYFAEVISDLINSIAQNRINKESADKKIKFIEQVCRHLSEVDPMKKVARAIINEYRK